MTSRQIRRERREAERKAAKLARKAALNHPAPPAVSEEEFSPEFIAEARAARERIRDRVARECIAQRSDEAVFSSEPKTRRDVNRANAPHSTGPVTPEGKLASSRNSLKHGLASGELIIPGEDRAAFESLLETLLREHQPANTTEEMLIHEMAQSHWLTQRALRLQNECFTADGIDDERTGRPVPVVRVDERRLALFLRYQTTHERAFHKALNTLMKLQRAHRASGARCARSETERRRAATDQSGFVSQQRASSGLETGFVSQNPAPPPESLPHPAENESAFPGHPLGRANTQANESLENEQPAAQAA